MWIAVIMIVVGGIAVKFFYDIDKQKQHVAKQGGMQHKYRELIQYIREADSRTKVYTDTGDRVTLGISNVGGTTLFTITQTFGRVTVQWKVDSPSFGNHNLEWEFDEFLDQKQMILKINNDLTKYQSNVMTSHGHEGVDSNDEWEALLSDDSVAERFKWVIRTFLKPHNIDPTKFTTNMDATSDPYRYLMYRDNKNFSSTLQQFQENPSLKAMGYPEWFYWAFPDVAMWAIRGQGNKLVKEKLEGLAEEDLVDFDKNHLKEGILKTIINLYLVDGELECKRQL